MLMNEWMKLTRNEKRKNQLCFSYSMLLNFLGDDTTKTLWNKLGPFIILIPQ